MNSYNFHNVITKSIAKIMMRNPFITLIALTFLNACSTNSDTAISNTEITKWQNGKIGAISITYDDATINQFRQALPIMDTLGFKGTFFINTADIPGSQFAPKFLGRPIDQIIQDTGKSPTNKDNLFERASALRFLDNENAVQSHNSAGSHYENEKFEESYKVVDGAFAEARKKKTRTERRPVLLTGDVITWNEIKEFAARGHEFGNHTISHPRLAVLDEQNLLYELEKCKEEILNQLGPEHTFSAECPFGTEDERVMKYAYKIHPALRNRMPEPFLEELNRWNKNTPGTSKKEYVQWQRGPLQKTSMELMKSWVDTLLVHDNVWLVLTFHGVDGIGWEAKPREELKEYFTYMKKSEDQLWVATFKEATQYIRERMHADLKAIKDGNTIMVNLRHSLNKDLYKLPLTLKTYINPDWKHVTIKQGKKTVTVTPASDGKGFYILYQAAPNAEKVVITGR